MTKLSCILLAASALALPATADAASVHYEGPEGSEVLVLTGAPGERNLMSIQDHEVEGAATFYDAGVTWTINTPYCSRSYSSVICPVPNGMRIEAGDADDWITLDDEVTEPVHMVGGTGDDRLEGALGADRLDGGVGNDRVNGFGGDDVLDGGAGNDIVDGYAGRDTVRGGDGDDTLHGDGYEQASPDLIDGGAGTDTIESDYTTRLTGDLEPLLHFTLAGGADDGRPGENDDVRNVERLVMSKGGRFIGTEGPDYVKLHQVGEDGVLDGRGGDDELRGGDGVDLIDAGPGNDRVDGGFNDDTIIGGPGRDVISADLAGGDCGPAWCKYPYGNDTVQVRDGEADSVSCGAGTDRVVADAIDTVAPDCETVERPAAPTPGPGTQGGQQGGAAGQGSPQGGTRRPALTVTKSRLRTSLRKGLTVRLKDFRPGRVTVTARVGRRVVAKRTTTVGSKGTATVTLRFTRAARRTLAGRRTATVVVKAGSLSRRTTLAR